MCKLDVPHTWCRNRSSRGIDLFSTLGEDLVRLNAQVFLGLLQHKPFPDDNKDEDEVPALAVSEMNADQAFNNAVSGILRQTVQGQDLPKYLDFMRRCIQLLEAGYNLTPEDLTTRDTTAVENRLQGDLPPGGSLPAREIDADNRRIRWRLRI